MYLILKDIVIIYNRDGIFKIDKIILNVYNQLLISKKILIKSIF